MTLTMEMSYHEAVTRAATALVKGEDANWELARLTYENTYQDGRISSQPGRVSMEEWCQEIRDRSGRKFSARTGKRYRRIWRKYGRPSVAHHPSWTEAFYAVTSSSKEKQDQRRAMHEARHAPVAVKVEMIEAIGNDPEVIEQASNLRSRASRALHKINRKVHARQEERQEQATAGDPIRQRFQHISGVLDIEAACLQFERECQQFLRDIIAAQRKTGSISSDETVWIQRCASRMRDVLGQVEHYVITGRSDLDTFLEEVLKGESL